LVFVNRIAIKVAEKYQTLPIITDFSRNILRNGRVIKREKPCIHRAFQVVGVAGFEPATSCSQSTKLNIDFIDTFKGLFKFCQSFCNKFLNCSMKNLGVDGY